MTAFLATDFNNLARLLFKCLTIQNPDFNSLKYLHEFDSLKTNLEKVNFVYEDIKKYPNDFAKHVNDKKDDELASEHLQTANDRYNTGDFWGSLESLNQAVAWAETDKMLALVYGQRALCFHDMTMPKLCLQEVERALPNYPKHLTEYLTTMRDKASAMEVSTTQYFEPPPESTPCVQIAQRQVTATRDIHIGEVISVEAPSVAVLTSDRFIHCHECLILCYNPIPCPNCTVALFCSQLCKNKARSYHKYECPILLTICYRLICEFSVDINMLLALRVTLLGKDSPSKPSVPETQLSSLDVFHQAILTALVFELLWGYTSLFSGIFTSPESKDQFKEMMLLHLQNLSANGAKIYEYVLKADFSGTNNIGLGAYPLFPHFPHSCCPNIMKTYHGTTMVLRALNTIKEGDQCFVNRYGLRYDSSNSVARQQFLFSQKHPKCVCKACEGNWSPHFGDTQPICDSLGLETMDLEAITREAIGTDPNKCALFLPKLIELLQECEDMEPEGDALAVKGLIAHCYVVLGSKRVEEPKRDVVFPLEQK